MPLLPALVVRLALLPTLLLASVATAQAPAPDRLLRISPLAGSLPLLGALPAEFHMAQGRSAAHVQLATTPNGERANAVATVRAGRLFLTAVRAVEGAASAAPSLSAVGVAVRASDPRAVEWQGFRWWMPVDVESSWTTQRGARALSLGARAPITVRARTASPWSGWLAPGIAWGHVRIRSCVDRGPDDNCGDLGLQVEPGRTRFTIGTGGAYHWRAAHIVAHAGVQQMITGADRPVLAVGASWTP